MPKTDRQRDPLDPDARMTTVQVARCIGISYQTAYNRVLSGVYGPSEYIEKTRTMTVRARTVLRAKRASEKQRKTRTR